jgi:heme A synthase
VTGLHVIGSVVSLVAAGMLVGGAGIAALFDRGHDAIRPLAVLVIGVFAVQSLLGVAVLVGGTQPSEILHLLYGIGLVAVVPLARTFAAEAPDRVRSGVLSVAGLVAIGLAWRLFATG